MGGLIHLAGGVSRGGDPRFGGHGEGVDSLKFLTPRASRYVAGEVPLRAASGAVVTARVLPVEPGDAVQVMDWYAEKPAGEPTYFANPKWRELWEEEIRHPALGHRVFKVVVGENQLLGTVAVAEHYSEVPGGPRYTWVKGIRIAPRCNRMMFEEPDYSGVGKALVTAVAVESLRNGDARVGLNATLGAEGFYRKLGMVARPSLDGIRTAFYLDDADAVKAFLKKQFQQYDAL